MLFSYKFLYDDFEEKMEELRMKEETLLKKEQELIEKEKSLDIKNNNIKKLQNNIKMLHDYNLNNNNSNLYDDNTNSNNDSNLNDNDDNNSNLKVNDLYNELSFDKNLFENNLKLLEMDGLTYTKINIGQMEEAIIYHKKCLKYIIIGLEIIKEKHNIISNIKDIINDSICD